MSLIVRLVIAIALVLLSASSWAQFSYFTLIDTDNDTATGCTVTLPVSGTVAGIERRLTASVSETATPQVTQLTLESCASGSFGALVALPGAPYPVGSNNGTGGADAVEQAVSAGAIAPPGATVRIYFAAQGPTSDDLLGSASGPPVLFGIQPSGGAADIPFLSGWGSLALALFLFIVVFRHRSRFPASVVGVLLVGMLAGIAWAAGFRLDGQVGDWQGVSAVGSDARGDSAAITDIVAAFAAQEGGNLFFRTDIANAETTPSSNRAPVFTSTAITTANVASPYNYAVTTSDPDNNALTLTAPTLPAWLTFTPGANGAGTLSGTPAAADAGPHAVVLRVTDNGTPNLSTDQAFTITVGAATNPAPVLDLNGPAAGIDFAATFTEGGSAIAIVDPVNLAVSDPDSLNLASATVTLANLLDAGQETLAVNPATVAPTTPVTATYNAATGVLTLTGSATLAQYQAALRTVTYSNTAAAPTATPARAITFVVSDGGNTSAVATATVTLTGVNNAPSFTKGVDQTVLEDSGPQTVVGWATAISAGPPDEAGQTLTFNVTGNTSPSLFSAGPAVASDGTLTYTPAANANGSATITLTLSDNGGTANGGVDTSAPQTFTIAVTPVNDQPSFTASNPPAVNESAGAQTVAGWATFNPGNPQESTQTVLAYTVSNVSNTALFSVQPSVATNGNLTYTPAAGANGTSTFSVAVQDSGGTTDGGVDISTSQSFTITVNAVNDPPVANPDSATVAEGGTVTVLASTATSVLANDTDPDTADILSATTAPVSGPTNGSLTLNANGTFSYTHNGGETTSDSFVYQVCDNGSPSLCANALVSITITPVNDGPTANADSATVNEGDTVTALTTPLAATSVRDNDTDADNLLTALTVTTTPVTPPANGTLTLNADGTFSYTHNGSETATDSFVYEICDPQPLCSTATVNIAITAANDAPVIDLPGAGVTYDTVTPVVLDAAATVADVDSPNFDTGVLTANVATACDTDDRLGVRNEGTGPNQIGVSGADVTYNPGTGAAIIGTIVTELDCATPAPLLAVTLTANADLTATQALLRNLAFFSASATPPTAQRVVQVVLTDGDGGTSNTATKLVDLDAAPSVSAVTPANNATGVAIDADVVITFSEAVTVTGNWFQIACPTSGNRSALSGTAVTGGPTAFTINPSADFANGEACTVTVTATQITDQDATDPPDNMAADFNSTFTTVDIAPTVLGTSTPANGAVVPTNQTVVLNFSEAVDVVPANIGLVCGATVTFTTSGTSNVTSITLTPTSTLPEGASCTLTVPVTAATDTDVVDPPDQLGAPFNRSFTVDTAPTFTGSTPTDGAIAVALNSDIQLTFSEAVNVTTGSFGIDCGGGGLAYAIGGSGTASVTLNPTADLPGGASCTVTITGANVSDSDGADPPDVLATNPSFSFTTASVANDDSYNATPHLTLSSAAGAAEVDANDQLGPGTITDFGFGACTGTAPGAQLDAGVTNGRLTLNADGSFSYEPPAGVSNTTKTFCYTVSGGDTANIVFTLQNTELVWFVDAAAAAGGVGNQARPFQTLTAAAGADTDGDTIFVKHNAAGYTCGITLQANEKLIGEGSGGTLQTLTGITPVAGSSFPTLTNNIAQWPNLTAAANCVTVGTNNTIRGFIFRSVGTGNTALFANDFTALTVNDAAISTNGRAVNLSNGAVTATFVAVSSSGSTTQAVFLNNLTGTVDLGDGAISGNAAGQVAFAATNGLGTVSYSGTIDKSTNGSLVEISGAGGGTVTLSGNLGCVGSCGGGGAGSHGILISGRNAGTISFTGVSKVFSGTSATPAINLINNTGATINFTGGGLAINTTSGAGFSATGGGTVNVTGSGNTITSGSGTALNVANTNIGASGLTFQSISANGAANGIVLNSTGTSGGLTVTGNSAGLCGGGVSSATPPATAVAPVIADCTGGTIQNSTGPGVSLTNASNVSLTRMRINNGSDDGIRGIGVNGFTLASSLVESNGPVGSPTFYTNLDFGEDQLNGFTGNFVGLTGTASITNSTIRSGSSNNVLVRNRDTVARSLNLTVTGSVIAGDSTRVNMNDGVLLEASQNASITGNVTGNVFSASRGDHFQSAASNNGNLDITFINNTLTGGHSTALGQGITINAATGVAFGGYTGRVDYDIDNNTINGAILSAITVNLGTSGAAGTFNGFVRNNDIGTTGTALSCSTQAHGIAVDAHGNGTHTVAVTGNTIRRCADFGMAVLANDGNGNLNLTVTGNTVTEMLDDNTPNGTPREAINLNLGATSTNVFGQIDSHAVCLALGGAGVLANSLTGGSFKNGDIRLRQRFRTSVVLPGYTPPGGNNFDTASVITFLQGNNPGATATATTNNDAAFTGEGYFGGAGCTLP